MEHSLWERIGAATGIGVFLVLVAVIVVSGTLTDLGETPTSREISRYVEENYESITAIRFMNILMAGLLIWFAGSVRTAIARTEQSGGRLANLSFAGGVLVGLLLLVSAALSQAQGDHIVRRDFSDATVSAFESLSAAVGSVMFVPVAIFAGAAAIAAIRYRSLPTWFGWLSLIFALLNVVGAASILWMSSRESGLEFLDLTPLIFLWVLATSIVLVIRPTWGKQPPVSSSC